MLSSASDDEVSGDQARSAPAMFAPPICRRNQRNVSRTKLVSRDSRFVGSDEDGGYPAKHRSERSEPSNTASTASEAIK
jgi:hypothetical protein